MQHLRDLADRSEQAVLGQGGRLRPLELRELFLPSREVMANIRRVNTTVMKRNPLVSRLRIHVVEV